MIHFDHLIIPIKNLIIESFFAYRIIFILMSLFNLFKKVEPETPKKMTNLDSTFFNMKVKQLPPNFAQTLMDLEMRL